MVCIAKLLKALHDAVYIYRKGSEYGVSEVSRKNKKGGVIIPDDNIT
jgi:hypothetical protein